MRSPKLGAILIFVIRWDMLLWSDFGRTDFADFHFEPPDFFADFVAGFFLLIFLWGKRAQRNPPQKSPAKSSKIYTTKIPDTFLQRGRPKCYIGKTVGFFLCNNLSANSIIDLLGLLEGPFSAMAGVPESSPTEMPTRTMVLICRFPFVTGPLSNLNGAFLRFRPKRPFCLSKIPWKTAH